MNQLPPFQTELYFADYEFTSPHILAASDCESMTITELLELADTSPEALLNQHLGYTESFGDPQLRELVANRYQSATPDDVLVLGSPIEGLYLISQVLNGESIVLTPAYDALKNLPANIKTWSLIPTETSWKLDFETLDTLATPQTELLVVNFPHNPTGFVPTPEEFQQLVDWTNRRNIRLFCDEMYAGLLRPTTPSIKSAVDCSETALILNGLSKSQGLPGLRAGWIVCRDRALLKRLHDAKLYTSICPPAPIEALAKIALTVEDKLVARNNQIINDNLQVASKFFQEHSNFFRFRSPLGGSIALVELLKISDAERWCRELADKNGVVLLPGSFLGFPDRFVRFGFGRKSFEADLAALQKGLAKSGVQT